MAQTLAQRWAAKIDTSGHPNGCWIWLAAKTCGYGVINIGNGITRKASRVTWELLIGPIPKGMHVLHRCDNPPCVNPAHLFLGTHLDNVADMNAKGRGAHVIGDMNAAKTHCLRGHEFTPQNTRTTPLQRVCRQCCRERIAAYRKAQRARHR